MRFLVIFALLLFGFTESAHAEWRKAVSPSFIVYGDMKEAPLLAFAKKVERFDTFLRRKFGIAGDSAPARMTIYIVNPSIPFGPLIRTGKKDIYTKGFYTSGPNGPIAVMQQLRSEGEYDLDADTVLFHEYFHHFMLQYFPAAYPAWFVEGFAEFYSTTEFNKGGFASYGRPAQHRAYDLILGKEIPIEQLLVADVAVLNNDERSSLYARGWLLTHYLMFVPERAGQLTSYINEINEGVEGLAAARKAFGDLASLNKALNAYRDKNKMTFLTQNATTPVSDAIAISLVEASEAATMIERIKVRRYADSEERAMLIASLEKAKIKFPASAAINVLLAQLYHEDENDKQAIVSADAALVQSPGQIDALLYRAIAEISELTRENSEDVARWKAARTMIIKANRADPENPYPLFHYYKSFQYQDLEPTKLARDGLAKAFELMPQDANLRYTFATDLIDQGRLADAIFVVKPMAFGPHGGQNGTYARSMIIRLQRAIKNGGRREDFEAAEDEAPPVAP
jgi:hypothetical protein